MEPTTIVQAIVDGDLDLVATALAAEPGLARAVVGAVDGDGATALHLAARRGHRDLVCALLDAGADIDARTTEPAGNRSALHDSYEHGQLAITDLLIERGADYDINVAAARGDVARVDAIIAVEPSLVDDDSTGLRPLGWAGYGQDPAMVGHLLERGATLGDELCCPCATGSTAIIRAFLNAGADPNLLSPSWRARPLHVTVAMPHSTDSTDALELLLAEGADPGLPAADERTTALDLANRLLAECDPATEPARHRGLVSMIAVLERASGLS